MSGAADMGKHIVMPVIHQHWIPRYNLPHEHAPETTHLFRARRSGPGRRRDRRNRRWCARHRSSRYRPPRHWPWPHRRTDHRRSQSPQPDSREFLTAKTSLRAEHERGCPILDAFSASRVGKHRTHPVILSGATFISGAKNLFLSCCLARSGACPMSRFWGMGKHDRVIAQLNSCERNLRRIRDDTLLQRQLHYLAEYDEMPAKTRN